MVKSSENVRKFYDVRFGELNIAIGEHGERMYCLIDICRILKLLKREGNAIVKNCSCNVAEYLVKRTRTVVSRLFVDESGLVTLATESRKNNADNFRKWAITNGKRMFGLTGYKPVVDVGGSVATAAPVVDGEGAEVGAPGGLNDVPTVYEYFKDYVPLDYFIPLLSDTLKDYLEKSKNDMDLKKKLVEHRVSVLNTFNVTLIENMKKGTFLCK